MFAVACESNLVCRKFQQTESGDKPRSAYSVLAIVLLRF